MGEMMRGAILAAVAAVGLLTGGALVMAMHAQSPVSDVNALHPERVIIGLDVSRSNPLVDDPAFAARVGERIAGIVARLSFASEVHIRTFGSYDAGVNSFAYDIVLSTRARPDYVASQVQKLIAGTPRLVATRRWRSQQKTNILAFLDNAVRAFGCGAMPTRIILASDGIEDSDYARLQQGGVLPTPDRRLYRGCGALVIYGIGQGAGSPVLTNRLRYQWENWARLAGFARFQGLNDW
jgi:hypothetical protein